MSKDPMDCRACGGKFVWGDKAGERVDPETGKPHECKGRKPFAGGGGFRGKSPEELGLERERQYDIRREAVLNAAVAWLGHRMSAETVDANTLKAEDVLEVADKFHAWVVKGRPSTVQAPAASSASRANDACEICDKELYKSGPTKAGGTYALCIEHYEARVAAARSAA